MLDELAKLTQDELRTFLTSEVFTGFTEQQMVAANEVDRCKMQLINEGIQHIATAKDLMERGRNLGQ